MGMPHVLRMFSEDEGVFRLNVKQWTIPLTVMMVIGLAGCANKNDPASINSDKQNPARPIGYYSNENHANNGNGFTTDNDGPITEMMDHTLGTEDQNALRRQQLQTRDKNGNPVNPTKPLAATDRNFLQRDNRFSTSDMNYHGHLNKKIGTMGMATNSKFQDNVTNQIRSKVEGMNNVQAVRSVSYGNTVTVSVTLIDKSKAKQTKAAIRKAVQPYANGNSVTVLTDEGAIGRDRNIDNDIQHQKGGR